MKANRNDHSRPERQLADSVRRCMDAIEAVRLAAIKARQSFDAMQANASDRAGEGETAGK